MVSELFRIFADYFLSNYGAKSRYNSMYARNGDAHCGQSSVPCGAGYGDGGDADVADGGGRAE